MRSLMFTLLTTCLALQTIAQNVGIGTNTPNHPLTVAADGSYRGIAQKNGSVEVGFWTSPGAAFLQTWSPHSLHFATNNGATRLTLEHGTGYFGVNTNLPSAHLDVNGTFRLRGNGAAAGYILTSDINGVATWQPAGSAGAWSLTGNAGTNPASNFLGTTDDQPIMLRLNNAYAGRFHRGLRNYAIGIYAGINSSAPSNLAIGDSALVYNQTGYGNIAIGSSALKNGLDYSQNVAIGDSALFRTGLNDDGGVALYGNQNVAVGSKALYENSIGYLNAAVGYHAGYGAYAGKRNAILGAYAMRYAGSIESEMSVAVGFQALDSTVRPKNTAVGAYSLRSNRMGDENVAVGYYSMLNNKTGDNNTAVGGESLQGNLDGFHNTAIGYRALNAVTTGNNNTAVGSDADVATGTLSNATAIGANAYALQSNSLVLGSINGWNRATASVNVGIGTPAPNHALDVTGNSVFGGRAHVRLYEADNDFARMKLMNSNTSNYWDIAGYPHSSNATSQLNFYYAGVGDVLSLRGDGNAFLTGTLTQSSDARLKTNVTAIAAPLNRLVKLNGYRYQWKETAKDTSPQLGVLAQEVEALFPELVKRDERGMLSVNYSGLVPVLVEAVKEQQKTIEKQQQLLQSLEQRLSALEKR